MIKLTEAQQGVLNSLKQDGGYIHQGHLSHVRPNGMCTRYNCRTICILIEKKALVIKETPEGLHWGLPDD